MAINCDTLVGIDKSCDPNRGSIVNLYVSDQLSVTATTSNSANTLTGITLDAGVSFVEIQFGRNAANYSVTLNRDEASTSRSYTATVNAKLGRRDITKRNAIMLLGEGDRELFLIVKDGNGIYWAFQNMILTGVGGGSGESRQVGSTFDLVFTGDSQELEVDITPSIIAGLI